MAANQIPRPTPRLPAGWVLTLSIDFLATCLAAVVLGGIGALLPGITEDYGPATGPTSPTALAFFFAAFILFSSLVATAAWVTQATTERSHTLALRLSAGRLALLALAAAAFIAYGIVTIELA